MISASKSLNIKQQLYSVLLVLISTSYGQSNDADLKSKRNPVIYVSVVSHFDQPWAMGIDDLDAFRDLTEKHPKMRWTHLYNPVAYTQLTPRFREMEAFVMRCRDRHGAEIGVHLHMYESLLKRAGVQFRNSPSLNAQSVAGSADGSGYSVPMTIYSRKEMDTLLDFTLKIFSDRGLGKPRSFCAGFYATNTELQKAIAARGFSVSAAAFPPGTEFGAKYAPSWHELAGWDQSVTVRSRPYKVSQKTILPTGKAPFIEAFDRNPLVEFPQTCKIDWMVSADNMKAIIREHLKLAQEGKMSAVCLAIHENNAAQHLEKYDEVLSYIDQQLNSKSGESVTVRYSTLSDLRRAFLAK